MKPTPAGSGQPAVAPGAAGTEVEASAAATAPPISAPTFAVSAPEPLDRHMEDALPASAVSQYIQPQPMEIDPSNEQLLQQLPAGFVQGAVKAYDKEGRIISEGRGSLAEAAHADNMDTDVANDVGACDADEPHWHQLPTQTSSRCATLRQLMSIGRLRCADWFAMPADLRQLRILAGNQKPPGIAFQQQHYSVAADTQHMPEQVADHTARTGGHSMQQPDASEAAAAGKHAGKAYEEMEHDFSKPSKEETAYDLSAHGRSVPRPAAAYSPSQVPAETFKAAGAPGANSQDASLPQGQEAIVTEAVREAAHERAGQAEAGTGPDAIPTASPDLPPGFGASRKQKKARHSGLSALGASHDVSDADLPSMDSEPDFPARLSPANALPLGEGQALVTPASARPAHPSVTQEWDTMPETGTAEHQPGLEGHAPSALQTADSTNADMPGAESTSAMGVPAEATPPQSARGAGADIAIPVPASSPEAATLPNQLEGGHGAATNPIAAQGLQSVGLARGSLSMLPQSSAGDAAPASQPKLISASEAFSALQPKQPLQIPKGPGRQRDRKKAVPPGSLSPPTLEPSDNQGQGPAMEEASSEDDSQDRPGSDHEDGRPDTDGESLMAHAAHHDLKHSVNIS